MANTNLRLLAFFLPLSLSATYASPSYTYIKNIFDDNTEILCTKKEEKELIVNTRSKEKPIDDMSRRTPALSLPESSSLTSRVSSQVYLKLSQVDVLQKRQYSNYVLSISSIEKTAIELYSLSNGYYDKRCIYCPKGPFEICCTSKAQMPSFDVFYWSVILCSWAYIPAYLCNLCSMHYCRRKICKSIYLKSN